MNDRDLDLYLDHVRSIQASTGTRRQLFSAVRAVWAYAPYLPPECCMSVAEPWQGRSPGELAEDIQTGRGNKTARIAVDTMIPLLDWALRIVEDIGPDVRDAWREFRQLYTGTHPGQARFAGLPRTERMNLFLRDAHRTGVALPGDPEDPGAIDYKYLACLLGLPVLSNSLGLGPRSIAEASGIPVAGGFFVGSVTGQVDGRPWRDKPITASELPELVWVVTAACFVIVSYLSGMRPGKCPISAAAAVRRIPIPGSCWCSGTAARATTAPRPSHTDRPAAPGPSSAPYTRPSTCWRRSTQPTLSSRPACPAAAAARVVEWAP